MMIFMDGFDYLPVTKFAEKWDNNPGASVVTGVYSKGKAYALTANLNKTLAANQTTFFMSFHLHLGGSYPNTSLFNSYLLFFTDGGTAQLTLCMDTSGHLYFSDKSGSGQQPSVMPGTSASSYVCPLNSWTWVEFKIVINNTTGAVSLYTNATQTINATNVNTRNGTTNNQITAFNFVAGGGGFQIDSFHMWNATSSTGNDPSSLPYGEHVIDTETATSNGSPIQWTPSTGTNASVVSNATNLTTPGTSSNSSATPGQSDSFNCAALSGWAGTIGIVAVNTIDQTTATNVLKHQVTDAGSSVLSGPNITQNSSYLNHQTFFPQNPGGGTPTNWTPTNRNNSQFGYNLVS